MDHYPKKRLGQNFLIDPNILRKIVRVIEPQKDDLIVEIGPGKGALTRLLLESGAEIHAIELDPELVNYLKQELAQYDNFHLYYADAVKFDFSDLLNRSRKIKIVGNIPYNITSPLLFRLFEMVDGLDRIVLLVQKEIALRLCAQPATKEYGILSVMTNFYCRPKIEFNVSPQVFRPIPRVTSSVVKFVPQENNYSPEFRRRFNDLVRKAFNRRRKILRNSLDLPASADISACPIDLSRRAETLNEAEFIELTNWYYTHFFLDKK
ncbi:MAG TPA: 16S rRNA (adenine(1518)-N(6)/adenine(1519)-N(6))-dimethyltransferase RsmA [Candidatus Marinimicrobia bacterium]|nr:16S rRNA (adenine(1518)-N(6)/adenine(1519)-N(6))-dimethyltransferase RsmA [Candidatus Neomarinimicrobiota bacterium]